MIGHETGVIYQYETSTRIKWKTFGDGKVQPNYEGEIKNGDNDEWIGTIFYPDGTKFIGERRGDFPWNGKYYNPFGRFQSKIGDGKIVKK